MRAALLVLLSLLVAEGRGWEEGLAWLEPGAHGTFHVARTRPGPRAGADTDTEGAKGVFNPDPDNDITMIMYTRSTRENGIRVNRTNTQAITDSGFESSKMTRVIIHGFSEDLETKWLYTAKEAFLGMEDSNVLLVFWGPLAASPWYPEAAYNTRPVGEHVAEFLNHLKKSFGLVGDNVHIVGFSLGAHAAGIAGANCDFIVGRITGLDAALPFFEFASPDEMLDLTDGDYVDVIHTEMGSIVSGGLSFSRPLGHVDFFPNAGRKQPGCTKPKLLAKARTPIRATEGNLEFLRDLARQMEISCSHSRAHDFFVESISIRQDRFKAFKCDSFEDYTNDLCFRHPINHMGLHSSPTPDGSFYLTTMGEPEFDAETIVIKVTIAGDQKGTYGWLDGTIEFDDGDLLEHKFFGDWHHTKAGEEFSTFATRLRGTKVTRVILQYKEYHGIGIGHHTDDLKIKDLVVVVSEDGVRHCYAQGVALMDKEPQVFEDQGQC